MTRFFVRPDQIEGDTVSLGPDDALHLDRVLKSRTGDEIGVLDGSGLLLTARLTALNKSRALATVVATEPIDTEPAVHVAVAQALPKSAEKLEWVLQHGVEVGAGEFLIFRSDRCSAGALAERPDRWARIVKTAAEQSGRGRLPGSRFAGDLDGIIAQTRSFDLALLCDEAEARVSVRHAIAQSVAPTASAPRILLIVGPEGGWTDDERVACVGAGIAAVTLGKRVLRTETAALVALAQILFALDAG